MFNLDDVVRPNIRNLAPYSSARDEFSGEARIFLDANENSLGSPLTRWYNRYPDPHQIRLKEKISAVKGIPVNHIFLGNGSDECIDILQRVFCEPGVDNIIICPPTYGMYEVSAAINNVEIKRVPLTAEFQLDLPALESAVDDHTKMIFLCSPNNPTGSSLRREDLQVLLNNYFGIVVIDEAYINFSPHPTLAGAIPDFPQLVIMQTLSKAWGLAALRVGMCFASVEIIELMNRVKPPYNIGQASQELALQALEEVEQVNDMIVAIVEQRSWLEQNLWQAPVVLRIYPSDANFLLVKVNAARAVYEYLLGRGIVVRDRSRVLLCDDCLRITVGTPKENEELLNALKNYQ